MRKIVIVPLALLGMVIFAFIGGQIVRLLWNGLLPPLFGWSEVTFWQALGLLVLCRILFGGFGLHGRERSNSSVRTRMADRIAERWATITAEERERFRQRRRELCGVAPAGGETNA